jgi:hypothetical protein
MKAIDRVKRGYFMNRKYEIIIGIVAVVIGCFLLWDAYDNRGKRMIWPFSGLAPW